MYNKYKCSECGSTLIKKKQPDVLCSCGSKMGVVFGASLDKAGIAMVKLEGNVEDEVLEMAKNRKNKKYFA